MRNNDQLRLMYIIIILIHMRNHIGVFVANINVFESFIIVHIIIIGTGEHH